MGDDQRVYSDEEFALVLRTAAELATRPDQPGVPSNGLTLAEMKSAAAQAGLDPALIDQAVRLLANRITQSPLERLVGGPLKHEHDARFSTRLDEHGAARVLFAVRINTHFHSSDPGHSSALGMAWKASGGGDVLSVIARPDADGTSVSIVIDRRGTFVLTGVLASAGLFGALIVATIVNSAAPPLAPWAAFAGIAGTLAAARGFWASSTMKARERIGKFMDAIGQALVHPESPRSIGDGTASPVRDESLAGDAVPRYRPR